MPPPTSICPVLIKIYISNCHLYLYEKYMNIPLILNILWHNIFQSGNIMRVFAVIA